MATIRLTPSTAWRATSTCVLSTSSRRPAVCRADCLPSPCRRTRSAAGRTTLATTWRPVRRPLFTAPRRTAPPSYSRRGSRRVRQSHTRELAVLGAQAAPGAARPARAFLCLNPARTRTLTSSPVPHTDRELQESAGAVRGAHVDPDARRLWCVLALAPSLVGAEPAHGPPAQCALTSEPVRPSSLSIRPRAALILIRSPLPPCARPSRRLSPPRRQGHPRRLRALLFPLSSRSRTLTTTTEHRRRPSWRSVRARRARRRTAWARDGRRGGG